MPIALHIEAMSCWAPNADTPTAWSSWLHQNIEPEGETPPDLAHIKPMQRRRLSLVARAAFHVGHTCLKSGDVVHDQTACVFATTYGQAASAEKMLQTMADAKPLSPTAFSLSVHNAIAGQFSIAHQLTAPSLTVASGREGIGGVFLQAAGLLTEPNISRVLVCCFEAPLPTALRPYTPNPPTPMAAAFLLSEVALAQNNLTLELTRSLALEAESSASLWAQLLQFVVFLHEQANTLDITSSGLNYNWTKRNSTL